MRQSGRTTMMLKAASLAKDEGRHILVVAFVHQFPYIQKLVREYDLHLDNRDFCSPLTAIAHRMRGKCRDDVFVDHYVWARWDSVVDVFHDEFEALPTRRQLDKQVLPLLGEPMPDEYCGCGLH